MKNTIIVLLIISVVILGLFVYSQAAAIQGQRRQLQKLTAKLESMPKTTSLDLQEKCTKQALEDFKREGYKLPRTKSLARGELADYSSHYNEKLTKCFVEIQDYDATKYPKLILTAKRVVDAFEGKTYASCMWQPGKNSWEVSALCSVKLPSGEDKVCQSSGEFDELVKQYME